MEGLERASSKDLSKKGGGIHQENGEAGRIGVDVWWDPEKSVYRKKRVNLEKIPVQFRCPCCGAVVVPSSDRKLSRRKIVDAEAHNKKIIDKYFEIEKPTYETYSGYIKWRKHIEKEHADEFKEDVYIEGYEPPFKLILNQQFYGHYACKKCVRNHPSHHTWEHHKEREDFIHALKEKFSGGVVEA